MKSNVIALIPARGGSKGILKKNMQLISALPLFVHTGITASKVKRINSVIVSSDSDEILKCADQYGFHSLRRPVVCATDNATTESVIKHALSQMPCEVVVLIQPTSPMLEASDIEVGLDKFYDGEYDSMFSAYKTNDMLMWDSDSMYPTNYDPRDRGRRQTRKRTLLVENGAFYIFKRRKFNLTQCRLSGKIGYSEMPFWRSFQVDNSKDLNGVRTLMTTRA